MYPIVTLRMLDLFPDSRGAAASMQSFLSLFIATVTMGLVAPLLAASMRRIAGRSLMQRVPADGCCGGSRSVTVQRTQGGRHDQPSRSMHASAGRRAAPTAAISPG